MARKKYDIAIVGTGLSGSLLASAFSRKNFKVALVDKSSGSGGLLKSQENQFGTWNHGLKVIPYSEKHLEAFKFVANLMGEPVVGQKITLPPLTIEKGETIPFLGFGEKTPKALDELNYYLSENFFEIKKPLHSWVPALLKNFNGDFYNNSHVSSINGQHGLVESLTLNDSKTLDVEKVIYCANPKGLLDLCDQSFTDAKTRQKISKLKRWTTVSLDFVHEKQITDRQSLYILLNTDHSVACVGQFDSTKDFQRSQWLTFVDPETISDEESATTIRDLKKLIKKAFPGSLDNIQLERILVNPESHGSHNFKWTERETLPGVDNLWVASSVGGPKGKNVLGTLPRFMDLAKHFDLLEIDHSDSFDSPPIIEPTEIEPPKTEPPLNP